MALDLVGLTTIRDNLVAEMNAETQRRLNLVLAGNPPPTTYSVSGKSVSWNEYLTNMQKLIQEYTSFIVSAGGDGGLYEQFTRGY